MSKLSELQAEYDAMLRILASLKGEPTPEFIADLMRLTKVIKGLGGRV
jgi:hypothetical protein